MEKKYPKFVVGAFIFDDKGNLFLRTTPSQDNKYTCINAKVEWGNTIEQTLRKNVKEKTNFDVKDFQLIGLTDGLNIIPGKDQEPINMIFADYKVFIKNSEDYKPNEKREYNWLPPIKWLEMEKQKFGPYIYEIIEKLV